MDIQLYGAFHKPFQRPEYCDWMHPIGVGNDRSVRDSLALNDSQGINISHLNPYYCELTAHFWVRYNRPSAYVGFYHYRRYLSYIQVPGVTAGSVPVHPQILSFLSSPEQYQELERLLNVYDAVIPHSPMDFDESLESQYLSKHEAYPWQVFKEMIAIHLPRYAKSIDYYTVITQPIVWNMYVMKWEMFCDYLDELMYVLGKVCDKVGFNMDHYQNRYPGFLAERFLGLYLLVNRATACRRPMIMLDGG